MTAFIVAQLLVYYDICLKWFTLNIVYLVSVLNTHKHTFLIDYFTFKRGRCVGSVTPPPTSLNYCRFNHRFNVNIIAEDYDLQKISFKYNNFYIPTI
jgi:hypothetical protein